MVREAGPPPSQKVMVTLQKLVGKEGEWQVRTARGPKATLSADWLG